MEDDEVEVVPMPQYPLPEQIHPEIHEAISNAQIWVVPGPSGGRSSFVQRNQNAPVFREVFLCRRNNASQAY
jgi:hypothetical protein